MECANQYLKNSFIQSYWNKTIVVEVENSTSEFTPIASNEELHDILIVKEYQKAEMTMLLVPGLNFSWLSLRIEAQLLSKK